MAVPTIHRNVRLGRTRDCVTLRSTGARLLIKLVEERVKEFPRNFGARCKERSGTVTCGNSHHVDADRSASNGVRERGCNGSSGGSCARRWRNSGWRGRSGRSGRLRRRTATRHRCSHRAHESAHDSERSGNTILTPMLHAGNGTAKRRGGCAPRAHSTAFERPATLPNHESFHRDTRRPCHQHRICRE